MFNFTQKHRITLIETNEQTAELREKYYAALKKIECLEAELNQKTHDLKLSCEAQSILSKGTKDCTATLYFVQSRLQSIAQHLDYSNNCNLELRQENVALKASGDEWLRRAIKLEFDVFTAKDEVATIKNERDAAIKMCARLQGELMSLNNENSRGKN